MQEHFSVMLPGSGGTRSQPTETPSPDKRAEWGTDGARASSPLRLLVETIGQAVLGTTLLVGLMALPTVLGRLLGVV